ncbi:MAG: glycosyltransferase family 2 protein [Clostridium sp.]|uniref:glycosyltransferase n=1 Tax=Clostridium sp. TaxID=1506 RepID=UPI0025BC306D|nr:glycosyltransferase family 2 protein [Clostridium sp.]MCH3965906.1 glycosyltransferase family 2 protein [Clostridium sp.]MCI1716005.1 glycosyltransferase family 2 protein [Clostridium sp.]MCI1800323.1 glycosyltransferase family 2 protein [Clostridium sp.]MCI1814182.1 glycosyltransferase family 2 protein [Clostridium sp.]MCI1871081.1 glycosyltransferase family 2 protein [Clostridium sp.]
MVSIVIPTFNEGINVVKIANRLKHVIYGILDYEVIFVDDSTDDTVTYIEKLIHKYKNIKYLHRENQRGLATAVVSGINMSLGKLIVVMDSDMQHPPEIIPGMVKYLKNGYDIVIPSRHLSGGDEYGLNIFRKLISHTALFIGKFFLKELRCITDPTGGFFAFNKNILDGISLDPIGWKILIEILVRGNYKNIKEIPYKFEKRQYGKSKMSFKEQFNYLRHIFRLVLSSSDDRRIFAFSLVGFSGVIVNMIVYNILIYFGLSVTISGTLSALTAMIGNFTLNRNITWKDKKSKKVFYEAFKFISVSIIGIIIDVAVLIFLNYKFKVNYNTANLSGICASILWNYNINRLWTWRK